MWLPIFLLVFFFLVELQKSSYPVLLLLDVSFYGSNFCSLKKTIIYRVLWFIPLIPAFRSRKQRKAAEAGGSL